MITEKTEKVVEVTPKLGGGPLGLGDPDDTRLRKTERDVIIPKLMREEASRRCSATVQKFAECSKKAGLLLPFMCREENKASLECMSEWSRNPQFQKEMTERYIQARSHYRRTGEPIEKYDRLKGRRH